MEFDIEDMRAFADKHRGKHVMSGPFWSVIARFPILFDEYEKTLVRARLAEKKINDMEKRLEDALGEIEHLKDTRQDPYDSIEILQAKLNTLSEQIRWRRYPDEKPEFNKWCLVMAGASEYPVPAYLSETDMMWKLWGSERGFELQDVICWMPPIKSLMKQQAQHIEEFAAAYLKRTNLDPTKAKLVSKQTLVDGVITNEWWFEPL